jgi:thioredoxin-dependent peroxiredoxin
MTLADVVKLLLGKGKGKMLELGQTAADFTVPDHTGTMRKLADYRGKTVILWFYPKADTPG